MKKALWFALFFIVLSACAYSLDIFAPSDVPEGSSFSVVASIKESNFDEIKVLLDSKVVFSQSLGAQADLQYISSYMPYNPNADKKLVVVFNPLSPDDYSVKVQLLKNSSVENEKSVTVHVFRALQSTALEPLKQDISSIKDDIKSLKSRADSLAADVEYTKKQISEISGKISSLEAALEEQAKVLQESKSQYDSVLSSINEMKRVLGTYNRLISELRAENDDLNAAIEALSSRLDSIEEKQESSMVGFITLGQSALIASAGIIIVVIIAVVLKRRRSRATLFESAESEPKVKGETSEMLEDIMPENEPKAGRWAYRGETEKKEEEKRFSLGDLIKRR